MIEKLPERRRFIRIDVPLRLIVKLVGQELEAVTKNISPIGLRFEVARQLDQPQELDLFLYLPLTDTPIHLQAKVVWQKRTSLEDNAPYDVGVEITDIDDANKNDFLKYLCDLFYKSTYKARA